MDPEEIARRLLAFERQVEPQDVEVSSLPRAAEDMEMWCREFGLDDNIAAPLRQVMVTLMLRMLRCGDGSLFGLREFYAINTMRRKSVCC